METKKQMISDVLHIFSNNNKVYFTNNNLDETDWSPINFHWIPMHKLQQELNHAIATNEN